MSNEPLGIYQELQERAKHYAEQGEAIRRRVMGLGPVVPLGAHAQPANPFQRGTARFRQPRGFYQGVYDLLPRELGKRRRPAWPEARLRIPVETVIQAVTIESELTVNDMMSPLRVKRLAWPRHVAMWAVDRYCPQYSLPEIGFMFKRDHTTVIHGIQAVNNRLHHGCETTSALVAAVRQRLAALVEGRS